MVPSTMMPPPAMSCFMPLALGTGVVRAVALQQVHHAPHAKASAEGNNEGLQSVDSRSEKLHIASLSPGMPRT